MLSFRSTIVWQEITGHLNHKKECMTHKKISGRPFALWEVKQKNTVLIRKRSLQVVVALERKLPYLCLMRKMLNTKVIVAIQGSPLILTVSYLSQECLKNRSRVNWLMILSLTTAKSTQDMTAQMTLELSKDSLLWFNSIIQGIQLLLTTTPN